MNLNILWDRVLIKLKTVEEEYGASKIVIADSLKQRHQNSVDKGVVVAVGPQAFLLKDGLKGNECAVGDIVVFCPNTGKNFTEDGTTYQILNDVDILAVIPQ